MKLGRIHVVQADARHRQLHTRQKWQAVWQTVAAFARGRMAPKVACRWLGIGKSRLYQLKLKWLAMAEKKPSPDWLYRRSKKSARQLPAKVQRLLRREIHYLKNESEFFKGHLNFSHLAEECQKRYGKRMHRNSLRRWALRNGLYKPGRDKTGKAFLRFEMGGIGMLFQHDSSHHLWIPHSGRKHTLIMTVDDHSRFIVGARLVDEDTSWWHLRVLRETFETYGCPLAYFTDNHMIFAPNTHTNAQFSRVLQALHVDLKHARKQHPEAKGKIEKLFDYFQRRVPQLCERRKVTSLKEANKILQEVVEFYNRFHVHSETNETPWARWNQAVKDHRSYLKPIDYDGSLDLLFGLHFEREVAKDGRVQFGGLIFRLSRAPRHGKITVIVRYPTSSRRPYTELFMVYKGTLLKHFILSKGQRFHRAFRFPER
jgi:transposase InsO family protein